MVERLVLLKSVLQAILIYIFSTLATPKSVLKNIRNIKENFSSKTHRRDKNEHLLNGNKSTNLKLMVA